jgi:hypothetical protein
MLVASLSLAALAALAIVARKIIRRKDTPGKRARDWHREIARRRAKGR